MWHITQVQICIGGLRMLILNEINMSSYALILEICIILIWNLSLSAKKLKKNFYKKTEKHLFFIVSVKMR